MNRITSAICITLMIVATLAVTACTDRSAAPAPAAPPEVGVVTVREQKAVLTTELTGRTAAYQVAEVRPQVSGIIQKRLFNEGTEVKQGEVLYLIDPAPYEAVQRQAEAQLGRAEANVVSLRLRADRYRDLVAINAISRQEYDDVSAQLMQAEAEIAAAQAAVETARINLDYTRVKAPIKGRIGRSSVTTGALVTANQSTALATIHQLDPIYADITRSIVDNLEFKQRVADGLITSGATGASDVRLQLESGATYPQSGTLEFSEVIVDQSTGSVVLRTLFPNPDQLLLPGMFVRVTIQDGIVERAVLIPQQGVGRNTRGEAVVLLVDADNRVEQRVVTVDRAIGQQWLISSGLAVGERLIVEGAQKVHPGSEVRVVVLDHNDENPVAEQQALQDTENGGM